MAASFIQLAPCLPTGFRSGPLSQIIQAAIDAGIAEGALRETVEFVTKRSRPWIDANVETATADPLTISAVGDLYLRFHAAEALLERAARFLQAAPIRRPKKSPR